MLYFHRRAAGLFSPKDISGCAAFCFRPTSTRRTHCCAGCEHDAVELRGTNAANKARLYVYMSPCSDVFFLAQVHTSPTAEDELGQCIFDGIMGVGCIEVRSQSWYYISSLVSCPVYISSSKTWLCVLKHRSDTLEVYLRLMHASEEQIQEQVCTRYIHRCEIRWTYCGVCALQQPTDGSTVTRAPSRYLENKPSKAGT